MANRIGLQSLLEDLLGSRNVYYQPPASIELKYPCIIYSKNAEDVTFANDSPYSHRQGYKITVVDQNPDSLIPGKIALLPTCRFSVHYTKDNLNHDVYNIYY